MRRWVDKRELKLAHLKAATRTAVEQIERKTNDSGVTPLVPAAI